jgi:acyl-CoA reductase-like NAD-dependent aldehyde dehydrogenase
MARPDLADELEAQFKRALENGAEIILPLERISENEFKPGLIRVQEGNPILKEELFGPLGMVMIAKMMKKHYKLPMIFLSDFPIQFGQKIKTVSYFY